MRSSVCGLIVRRRSILLPNLSGEGGTAAPRLLYVYPLGNYANCLTLFRLSIDAENPAKSGQRNEIGL